jgi:hypothetical protein
MLSSVDYSISYRDFSHKFLDNRQLLSHSFQLAVAISPGIKALQQRSRSGELSATLTYGNYAITLEKNSPGAFLHLRHQHSSRKASLIICWILSLVTEPSLTNVTCRRGLTSIVAKRRYLSNDVFLKIVQIFLYFNSFVQSVTCNGNPLVYSFIFKAHSSLIGRVLACSPCSFSL